MKSFLLLVLSGLPSLLVAQTEMTKSIPTQAGQPVTMKFADPERVSVEVWEKSTIEIVASVSINRGENDDAFQIDADDTGEALNIATSVKNKEALPERITIRHGGQDYYFNTDDQSHPDVQAFLEEHGRDNIQWISHGPAIAITVKVFVPKDLDLQINSKFGLIEMKGTTRSLAMHSQHGGLDLAVSPTAALDLAVDCDWGEVYTDLDVNVLPTEQGEMLKAQQFVARLNGGGPAVRLTSEHGNVYLRAL